MKTLAIALSVLILAVAIQDVYGRPPRRNQGDDGQRQGQSPQGQRGQRGQGGQRGGQVGPGLQQRGPRRGGRPNGGPKPCLLMNVTNANEVLCNSTCPAFMDCVAAPKAADNAPLTVEGGRPPFPESLEVHFCLPKSCGPDTACPNGTVCRTLGEESRCLPTRPPRRRHDSSEESSEESEESSEESDELVDSAEEDKDEKCCKKVLKNIMRGEREGEREEGARPSRDGPFAGIPRPQLDGRLGRLFGNGGSANGGSQPQPRDNRPFRQARQPRQ